MRVRHHSASYTGLTMGGAVMATGNPGAAFAVGLNFRVLLSWVKDPFGDYGIEFTYTLTTA